MSRLQRLARKLELVAGREQRYAHFTYNLRIGNSQRRQHWQFGSVRRDPDSLKVNFSLYDAEGSVTVSYEGILPDLFREGQGVVVQGTLEKGNHVLAHEVLAKHDENYTPPEVEKAMQENHRRPQRADKDTSS